MKYFTFNLLWQIKMLCTKLQWIFFQKIIYIHEFVLCLLDGPVKKKRYVNAEDLVWWSVVLVNNCGHW